MRQYFPSLNFAKRDVNCVQATRRCAERGDMQRESFFNIDSRVQSKWRPNLQKNAGRVKMVHSTQTRFVFNGFFAAIFVHNEPNSHETLPGGHSSDQCSDFGEQDFCRTCRKT